MSNINPVLMKYSIFLVKISQQRRFATEKEGLLLRKHVYQQIQRSIHNFDDEVDSDINTGIACALEGTTVCWQYCNLEGVARSLLLKKDT